MIKKEFSKNIIAVLLILFLGFILISSVSAFKEDNNLTQISDVSIQDNTYSFDELADEINRTPENQTLTLNHDYEYVSGHNRGILISKPITIDGAGHTLNGKSQSRIFNITSDNVVIKNINFINGNAYGRYFSNSAGGGAIYWSGSNGLLENCNFINNTGYGIEDDPFDKEETIVSEDGTVIHTISFRPMGAKTNEGGAIVWKGSKGTVSKCIFINNNVGYPNMGGAICWRGDDGKIISSQFFENSAWCGAAICWIGNNGEISYSKLIKNGFFDGGIYWFGKNGCVKYSILLGLDEMSVLRPADGDIDADYNFWGDTIDNLNKIIKLNNVKKWFVLNTTHNGEFLTKGTSVLVSYDINSLFDNGIIISFDSPIDYSGEIYYTAPKTGFLTVDVKNGQVSIKIDSKDRIVSKNLKKYYSGKVIYKVKISDVLGKVVAGKVTFKVGRKTYNVLTDKEGVATLKIKLKPGKYTVYTYYCDDKAKNKIMIKNTLITKNLSKKVKKSKNFNVKVLNSKGKAFKKQLVKIAFKGKNYKIKTNQNGMATFKIPKKLKVGKYNIKTTYNGLTNLNKIIVKK